MLFLCLFCSWKTSTRSQWLAERANPTVQIKLWSNPIAFFFFLNIHVFKSQSDRERGRKREQGQRKVSHLLIHCPEGHNDQATVRSESGQSQQPSMLPGPPSQVAGVHVLEPSSVTSASAGNWIKSKATGSWTWHSGLGCWQCKQQLTLARHYTSPYHMLSWLITPAWKQSNYPLKATLALILIFKTKSGRWKNTATHSSHIVLKA